MADGAAVYFDNKGCEHDYSGDAKIANGGELGGKRSGTITGPVPCGAGEASVGPNADEVVAVRTFPLNNQAVCLGPLAGLGSARLLAEDSSSSCDLCGWCGVRRYGQGGEDGDFLVCRWWR